MICKIKNYSNLEQNFSTVVSHVCTNIVYQILTRYIYIHFIVEPLLYESQLSEKRLNRMNSE